MVMRGGFAHQSEKPNQCRWIWSRPLPLKRVVPHHGPRIERPAHDPGQRCIGPGMAQFQKSNICVRCCATPQKPWPPKALTGAITWPVRLDGGQYDTWTYAWGATKTVAAAIKWDSAEPKPTAADIRALLKGHAHPGPVKRGLGAKNPLSCGRRRLPGRVQRGRKHDCGASPQGRLRAEAKRGSH